MDETFFTLWNFSVSYSLLLETVASLITLVCILLAVKEKIWTFPLGMLGTSLYFFVFYMQRVYSSMVLQVMFFAFNAYGLYKWTHPGKGETKPDNTLAVTLLSVKGRIICGTTIILLTIVLGYIMSHLHLWLPALFAEEAKHVYIDTFILSASLVAQYLMAIKKLENWALWFVINIISTIFYIENVGWATGILYFVFIFTAVSGWFEWKKSYKLH